MQQLPQRNANDLSQLSHVVHIDRALPGLKLAEPTLHEAVLIRDVLLSQASSQPCMSEIARKD